MKCTPSCCSARCLSACESCDGSCGVEGQQQEEGRFMRRSIARVSASRQGFAWKSKQKVRTHIVQNLTQQRECLGVGHCARLEFRKHFHDDVAACLTRGERSGVLRQRVASSRGRQNGGCSCGFCLNSMMSMLVRRWFARVDLHLSDLATVVLAQIGI